MQKNLTRFFYAAFMIILSLTACTIKEDKEPLTESTDVEFLSTFFLVSNAKSFPVSSDINKCRSQVSEPCHKLIKRIDQARQKLLEMPHEVALAITLNQIHQYCKLEESPSLENEAKCSGPFSALYFFSTASDDKKIINSLSLLDKKLLEELFRTKRSWIFNRTELKLWEEFAELKLNGVWRDIFVEDLNQIAPNVFGLQLLEN